MALVYRKPTSDATAFPQPFRSWLLGRGCVIHVARFKLRRAAPAVINSQKDFMSQHRSLRAAASLGGKRNVLKRFERVEILKKRGQWKAGDRITGLRKTKADTV